MPRVFLFILPLISFILPVNAQEFNDWETVTSVRKTNGGVQLPQGQFWVLTSGGIAVYDGKDLLKTMTTLDGLSRLDGTAIAHNPAANQVFISYIDGIIDAIDTESGAVRVLNDIERAASYNSKAIHDLYVTGDTLLVATDFGIVHYDTQNLYVRDTYSKLGGLPRGTPVFTLGLLENKLLAGTASGLAVAESADDLTENGWVIYDETNSSIKGPVTAAGAFDGVIYATSEDKNYLFNGSTWVQNSDISDTPVLFYGLSQSGESFALMARDRIIVMDGAGVNSYSLDPYKADSFVKQAAYNTEIVFGAENEGIAKLNLNSASIETFPLNEPFRNNFEGISFDGEVMISGSSRQSVRNTTEDRAKGFYICEDGEWQNINYFTDAVMKSKDAMLVFSSLPTEDYYYFGSWGKGVIRYNKETKETQVFNHTNSTIRGWDIDSPTYPVITGLGEDSTGDVWIVSRFGPAPLYVQAPGEDDWRAFRPDAAISFGDYYENLFVDSNDQKWIPLQNSSAAGTGLLVLDTGETDNPDDDRGIKLTTNENAGNLPSNKVTAILEDRNNEIWIGTERGVARFLFPEYIIDGSASERRAQWLINEDTTAVSGFLLRDVNVSAMAVNAANEKWIGSKNQGVWLVNEEGTRILKRFTKDNSPLFSNNIISIAVNDIDGRVYIATESGMLAYKDVPRSPAVKMKNLKVYPNPFSYDKYEEIKIEGLAEETTINIFGADGTVVNTLTKKGGRISWDGRDFNGNRLGSGVYFVVAVQAEGRQRGTGKVIIIN